MIAGQPFTAMDGLTQSYIFKQKLQNCESIGLSCFVVDFRERHLEYWAPHSETHPRVHNSKRSICRALVITNTVLFLQEGLWSIIRLTSKYMFLNLPRDVTRSAARFRLASCSQSHRDT